MPPSLYSLAPIASSAEVAIDAADPDALPAYIDVIDGLMADGVIVTTGWPHFLPRIRAELAVAAGDADADGARRSRGRHRSPRGNGAGGGAARTAAQQPRRGQPAAWSTLLGRCAPPMPRVCSRWWRRRVGGCRSSAGRHIGRFARALLNTDIVSSTTLTRELGDDLWVEVLAEHDALVRAVVRRFGGVVFKHTGDGVFAWFISPAAAIDCAEALIDEFDSRRFNHGRTRLQIRAGLALGEPIARDGDLFGVSVVEAVRLCSVATDGRGLASAAVVQAAGRSLRSRGTALLKGFDEPIDVFEVGPVG